MGGDSSKKQSSSFFTLATFNVHMWTDGEYKDNVDRVYKLIKKHKPHVLCLQESTRSRESVFRDKLELCSERRRPDSQVENPKLELRHLCNGKRQCGCTIFSKYYLEEEIHSKKRASARYVTAAIHLNNETRIWVTCLHLDHAKEPRRLSELESIMSNLKERSEPHILTGDFNALTKEDYDHLTWKSVADIRETNNWESPRTELTTQVKVKHGFKDCWELCGRSGPLETCRFDTRIDYIFVNDAFLQLFNVVSTHAIPDSASDHNLVMAKFQFKGESEQSTDQ